MGVAPFFSVSQVPRLLRNTKHSRDVQNTGPGENRRERASPLDAATVTATQRPAWEGAPRPHPAAGSGPVTEGGPQQEGCSQVSPPHPEAGGPQHNRGPRLHPHEHNMNEHTASTSYNRA